jgi:hypothetical protein
MGAGPALWFHRKAMVLIVPNYYSGLEKTVTEYRCWDVAGFSSAEKPIAI